LAAEIGRRFHHETGRLRMAAADGPLGPIFDGDDGATASSESLALALFVRLAERSDQAAPRLRAEALAAAMSGRVAAGPVTRIDALRSATQSMAGPSEARRAVSHGKVFLAARRDGPDLQVRLRVAEGWHITAHAPSAEWAEGVSLAAAGGPLTDIRYPAAEVRTFEFSPDPLEIYEGDVEIAATVAEAGEVVVDLTLQACSDRVCLAAETAQFRFR
jgi:hypothetical protein